MRDVISVRATGLPLRQGGLPQPNSRWMLWLNRKDEQNLIVTRWPTGQGVGTSKQMEFEQRCARESCGSHPRQPLNEANSAIKTKLGRCSDRSLMIAPEPPELSSSSPVESNLSEGLMNVYHAFVCSRKSQ